jgi:hypothetical protein
VREVRLDYFYSALLKGPRTDQHPPSLRPSKERKKTRWIPGTKEPGKNTTKEQNKDEEYASEKVSGDKLMSPPKEMMSSTA